MQHFVLRHAHISYMGAYLQHKNAQVLLPCVINKKYFITGDTITQKVSWAHFSMFMYDMTFKKWGLEDSSELG